MTIYRKVTMKLKHLWIGLFGLTFSTIFITGLEVTVGSVINQGHKKEDRVTVNLNFANTPDQHLFGVFDGHIGNNAANFVSEELPEYLEITKFKNKPIKSINTTFEYLEGKLAEDSWDKSGTTATSALFLETKMWIAHIGDSRAVLSHNGKAIQLTTDHIPNDPQNPTNETKRILATGTSVVYGEIPGKPKDLWWINKPGGYPLTRSLGVAGWKQFSKGSIIATPEIKVYEITLDDEFLILGTDGLWDFAPSNQFIIDMANKLFNQGKNPKEVAEELARFIREDKKGGDDIGIVVVKFIHSK